MRKLINNAKKNTIKNHKRTLYYNLHLPSINLEPAVLTCRSFRILTIPSHNDLGSDLDVSSPSGDRNKIYDPGICIGVESKRFLATFSSVIDTLLPFSSENKDKVFSHGVLVSKEKSPHSSSHRGFKAFKLFHHKSPMLIHGEDIPILDVLIAPDYEASCARGFVLRSLELQVLSFIIGIQYPNLIDKRLSLSILNKRLRIYVETLLKTLRTMFNSSMGDLSI
ncbi:hypothetical protein Tco_0414743 [Tanacetum coccineum]